MIVVGVVFGEFVCLVWFRVTCRFDCWLVGLVIVLLFVVYCIGFGCLMVDFWLFI